MRPGSTTSCWAAATTSRLTGKPRPRCRTWCRNSARSPGRTAGSISGPRAGSPDQGISQFLDIGCGLLTVGNTHEVVREVRPATRVVYVDMDPMVAQQAAVLRGDPEATFIQADLRDPAPLITDPRLGELIDLGQPAGLVMTGVMHFVADGSDPWRLVRAYLDRLAPGSFVALSHGTSERGAADRGAALAGRIRGRAGAVPPAVPGAIAPVLRRPRPGAAVCRRPELRWCIWACGAARTPGWRTARGPAGGTAGWPEGRVR